MAIDYEKLLIEVDGLIERMQPTGVNVAAGGVRGFVTGKRERNSVAKASLFEAIRNGDEERARSIFNSNRLSGDVRSTLLSGKPALTMAMQNGMSGLAADLLRAGANANISDGAFTAIHYAKSAHDVHLLKWHGADLNALTIRPKISIDAPVYGATALHNAVRSGDRELALALIDAGADVHVLDHQAKVPAAYAADADQTLRSKLGHIDVREEVKAEPEAVSRIRSFYADKRARDLESLDTHRVAAKRGSDRAIVTGAIGLMAGFGLVSAAPAAVGVAGGIMVTTAAVTAAGIIASRLGLRAAEQDIKRSTSLLSRAAAEVVAEFKKDARGGFLSRLYERVSDLVNRPVVRPAQLLAQMVRKDGPVRSVEAQSLAGATDGMFAALKGQSVRQQGPTGIDRVEPRFAERASVTAHFGWIEATEDDAALLRETRMELGAYDEHNGRYLVRLSERALHAFNTFSSAYKFELHALPSGFTDGATGERVIPIDQFDEASLKAYEASVKFDAASRPEESSHIPMAKLQEVAAEKRRRLEASRELPSAAKEVGWDSSLGVAG
jgi:hypothetical protein